MRIQQGLIGLGALLIAVLVFSSGCSPSNKGDSITSSVVAQDGEKLQPSPYNVNKHLLSKVVCDPFGSAPPEDPKQGVKASLFYRATGMPRYYTAAEYVNKTVASSQSLFFTDLHVPTRMFSEGFATRTNAVVKDDIGNRLIEYFGLKFETVIRLRPDQPEGLYEFASLADDGTVMRAKINGQWQTLINNDGDHPTQMGCSSQLVQMNRNTELPVEIQYYQGPRFHIAHVLLMKQSTQAGKDPECNKLGNNYFFDPDRGSMELAPYKGLIARGWQTLESGNYYLNVKEEYNPCVVGSSPKISMFRISEAEAGSIMFMWDTDMPATAQILVKNLSTGEETVTLSDNNLRTSHIVTVSGLQIGVTYQFQAVAITADLGKAFSSPVSYRFE